MTIYELALEYGKSAGRLRERISELERLRRETEDEELQAQLERRVRPLRAMYRDTRAVARCLEDYYIRIDRRKRRKEQ